MEVLLPKLAEYGVAVFAIGVMSVLMWVVVKALIGTFSREMAAERELQARQLRAAEQNFGAVGDKLDGLGNKVDGWGRRLDRKIDGLAGRAAAHEYDAPEHAPRSEP